MPPPSFPFNQFKAEFMKFRKAIFIWPLRYFKNMRETSALFISFQFPSTISINWSFNMLTNNHVKFLTPTSIGLARLMDIPPTITFTDWHMSKLRKTSLSIKLLYKIQIFQWIHLFETSDIHMNYRVKPNEPRL